ncbi:MAG: NYN domain-containing protein [Patescibacteria group bacterium]|nr:NYN domain-containing protein [Patescibacteria group bacterium]
MLEKNIKKIAIFIDAGNLWSSYKEIGKVLDFSKFKEFFSDQFIGDIFKIFYYVAFPENGRRSDDEINKLHKFFTYLRKGLGIEVIKKPLKTIFLRDSKGELIYDQDTGELKSIEKGNFDVEIAIDATRYSSAYDTAIFFTGDSDFLPLITYLKTAGRVGKRIFIFSTDRSISRELKTGAHGYYDIADYPEIHGKKLINKIKNNPHKP